MPDILKRSVLPNLFVIGLVAVVLFPTAVKTCLAADAAVFLMYHRFGEDTYPSTNIRLDQFEAHLDELSHGGYAVLPLPMVMRAIRAGEELPDRTVVITVDDAYLSVYTEAWPRFRARGFPFTLFVATDGIDRGFRDLMTWDQIRELKAAGVTIGNHTVRHPHLPDLSLAETGAEIEHANERIRAELGEAPRFLAYPFGEASSETVVTVRKIGFDAAFGQHSGVVYAGAELHYLPRFALNERYGELDRFRLIANTLPLPVTDMTPANPTLGPNPPAFAFTLADEIANAEALNCFASHGDARLIVNGRRIEVGVETAFPPGHARFNCTLPAGDGRWRWFGMQYYVPR